MLILVGVAVLGFLLFYRSPDPSAEGKKTVIRLWHPWGGTMMEAFKSGADRFAASHPEIGCKLLYVPNDIASSQKFYTAVIGNCAPEVMFVDGTQVAEWAEKKLLTPLDDLLVEAGIDPKKLEKEFFPPCWRQCVYRGKIYAITFCADVNFCFFWNKDAIRKAIDDGQIPPGTIDPERAPRTIAELDRYNAAVTRVRNTGAGEQIERIGLVPWGVYGNANSIFTWGWAFGGEFFDDQRFRITANDPNVVAALDWMCQYARKYNPQHIATLQSGFGTAEQNAFIIGKQVMQLFHVSGLKELDKYAPNLRYGMAPIPRREGVNGDGSWVGGWTLAIPSSVSDVEKRKAALKFILWACASPEGTSLEIRTSQIIPAWKNSPFFPEANKDPRLSVYMRILENCRHQRPVMPVQAFYMDQLNRAVDKAVRGEKTPKEALDEATRKTQERLDELLAESGGAR